MSLSLIALVSKSAGCCLVPTNDSCRLPSLILSRTKWQSISMCLVRSWNTGLFAMWIADTLSQKSWATASHFIPKSCKRYWKKVMSLLALAMERYSAVAEERETTCCFFDFQEIRESPKSIQKPETERRVTGWDHKILLMWAYCQICIVTLVQGIKVPEDFHSCIHVRLTGVSHILT